jgi:hypothetical protein
MKQTETLSNEYNPKKTSLELKEKGNIYFHKNEIESAIKYYNSALVNNISTEKGTF